MEGNPSFDVLVVGRGLLASATARHLVNQNLNVALIGPTEEQSSNSKNVFASHYDNTRVQRIIAEDSLWTRLNLDSARSWQFLQDQTGIDFYQQNGCLYINDHKDEYLKSAPKIAKDFGLHFENVSSSADLKAISPKLSIAGDIFGIYESNLAGQINPRKLVTAQLKAFADHGGIEVNDLVTDVSQSSDGWIIQTLSGQNYFAKKVLVAAGASTNFFNLIPRPLKFENKSEVVIMGRLSKDDYLQMRHMPSLLFEINFEDFDGIYLTAPIETPDGRYVLKMGMNQKLDLNLDDQSAMNDWFTGEGQKAFAPVLERGLAKLFPDVTFLETELKKCVISRTFTKNPYIGEIDKDLYVVHGCNGYSAMSSDAQGRQAAALITTGKFDQGYQESDFALVYK
jgi:glycine/D-amino acid oxidase-like deaminating enzyme